MTKSHTHTVNDLRRFAYDMIFDFDEKINDLAIVDIFNNNVVVYYTWTWYKKKLKKVGELGRPFIIRKNDIFTREGGISMPKREALMRKLVNYLIYQRENGKMFKIPSN